MATSSRAALGRWAWIAPSLLGGALAVAAFVSIVRTGDASAPGEYGEALLFVSQMDSIAEGARSSGNTRTLELAAGVSRQIAIDRSDLLGRVVAPEDARQTEQAIIALSRVPYGLILMDCQMPEMDGYEATAAIRARFAANRIAIIAMTAHALDGDRERCIAAGMDDYLAKPVQIDQLRETIERWSPVIVPEAAAGGTNAEPPRPRDEPEAPIDAARIRALGLIEPDAAGVGIAMLFRDQARATIEAVQEGQAAEHQDAVRRAAHSLKGSAANLGATRLAELARQLEHANLGAAGGTIDAIRAETARVVAALEALEASEAAA